MLARWLKLELVWKWDTAHVFFLSSVFSCVSVTPVVILVMDRIMEDRWSANIHYLPADSIPETSWGLKAEEEERKETITQNKALIANEGKRDQFTPKRFSTEDERKHFFYVLQSCCSHSHLPMWHPNVTLFAFNNFHIFIGTWISSFSLLLQICF